MYCVCAYGFPPIHVRCARVPRSLFTVTSTDRYMEQQTFSATPGCPGGYALCGSRVWRLPAAAAAAAVGLNCYVRLVVKLTCVCVCMFVLCV